MVANPCADSKPMAAMISTDGPTADRLPENAAIPAGRLSTPTPTIALTKLNTSLGMLAVPVPETAPACCLLLFAPPLPAPNLGAFLAPGLLAGEAPPRSDSSGAIGSLPAGAAADEDPPSKNAWEDREARTIRRRSGARAAIPLILNIFVVGRQERWISASSAPRSPSAVVVRGWHGCLLQFEAKIVGDRASTPGEPEGESRPAFRSRNVASSALDILSRRRIRV
jgi:hypothetical protein